MMTMFGVIFNHFSGKRLLGTLYKKSNVAHAQNYHAMSRQTCPNPWNTLYRLFEKTRNFIFPRFIIDTFVESRHCIEINCGIKKSWSLNNRGLKHAARRIIKISWFIIETIVLCGIKAFQPPTMTHGVIFPYLRYPQTQFCLYAAHICIWVWDPCYIMWQKCKLPSLGCL